jgi:ribonuclease Y
MDLLTPGSGIGMFIASILLSLIPIILIGILVGFLLYKRKIKKNKEVVEEKAKLIIREAELQAENIKKDRILDAKEKLLKMKQEFEEEANRKKNQIIANEQKIKQRESQLSKELETLKRKGI